MCMLSVVLHPCTTHSAPSYENCYCLPLIHYMIPLLTSIRQCLGVLWPIGMLLQIQRNLSAPCTIDGSTSDHNYCQTRMNYDYFITTILSKQHSNTNTKFYSLLPLAAASGLFGHQPMLLLASSPSSCCLFFFLAGNRISITMTHIHIRSYTTKVHSNTTFFWYSPTDLNGIICSTKEMTNMCSTTQPITLSTANA